MWRDLAKKDLKVTEIDGDTWYEKALNRQEWLKACNEGVRSKHHQAQQQLFRGPKEVECTVLCVTRHIINTHMREGGQ